MLPRDGNPALHDAVVALSREAGLSPVFVEAPQPRVEAVLLAVAAGGGASAAARFGRAAVRDTRESGSSMSSEPRRRSRRSY